MTDPIEEKIRNAILVMLRPFVAILLRCGIGFRDFAELVKFAYVDVASKSYGIRGRPTNISRVAVMTGLTRKEVRRLRDLIDAGEPAPEVRTTPMAHVLRAWHTEEAYLDEDSHTPLPLPFDGSDGVTFSRLVKDFGGDIPPGAMRTEFSRVGVIRIDDDGLIHPLRRVARPVDFDDRVTTYLTHMLYPAVLSVAHNLDKDPDKNQTWPNLTAYTSKVSVKDIPRVIRICGDRITDTAKVIDDLFVSYERLRDDDSAADLRSIGVSMFLFEDTDSDRRYVWQSPENSGTERSSN